MKKKFLFLLLFTFCFNTYINSQTANWLWARQSTSSLSAGATSQEGLIECTDPLGNVYIGGFFNTPTITFGSYTLTNTGAWTSFIAKYDSSGNIIWAQTLDGADSLYLKSICSDKLGNIYITGGFQCPLITFGSFTLNNTNPASMSMTTTNLYLVKYDPSGNVLMARSAPGYLIGNSICSDALNNIYIGGCYWFSSATFDSFTITNSGGNDSFVAKFDTGGNVVWVKKIGASSDDVLLSVSTDPSGNVFASGRFASSSIAIGIYTLSNTGASDFFIAKYDSTGNALWAKSSVGNLDEEATSMSIDKYGNTYVIGFFTSPSISIGPYNFANVPFGAVWNSNFFIVKYNASGIVLWAKSEGGPNVEKAISVCADSVGNTYVTGMYLGASMNFDSYTVSIPSGTSCPGGYCDPIFFVKYNSAGIVQSAVALPSGGDDENQVKTDPFGNVYLVGDFLSDTLVLADTLFRTCVENVFVAKYGTNITTGVSTNDNFSFEFKISPNPLTLSSIISFDNEMKNATLRLFDVSGRVVKNIKFSGRNVIIEKDELRNGLYIVQISYEAGNVINKKLVVQ